VSPVIYGLGSHIPEDGVLHSHRRENFKSYINYGNFTKEPEVYYLGYLACAISVLLCFGYLNS
jgi:hypothetical protein